MLFWMSLVAGMCTTCIPISSEAAVRVQGNTHEKPDIVCRMRLSRPLYDSPTTFQRFASKLELC